MQGRENYSKGEIAHRKAAIDEQLAAYNKLLKTMPTPAADKKLNAALEPFEARFFNNLTLVLDRYFVHRLAVANYEGKDGNPLNEVRMICDSLITNNGVMRSDKRIKLRLDRSITHFDVDDEMTMTQDAFDRLSAAFFSELERRFS